MIFKAAGAVALLTLSHSALAADWSAAETDGRPVPVGDVNGDGFEDLLYFDTFPAWNLRLYLGSSLGTNLALPDATFVDPDSRLLERPHMLGVGQDLNGDGFDDVAFSLNYYGDRRELVVFYGGPSGGLQPTVVDSVPYEGLGFVSLALVEDLNGDGFAELATIRDSEDSYSLLVYWGGANGPSSPTEFVLDEDGSHGVITSGDVDGDGYADLLVGFSNTVRWSAMLYGGSSGLDVARAVVVEEAASGFSDYLPRIAGDLDGDGLADVISELGDVLELRPGTTAGLGAAVPLGPVVRFDRYSHLLVQDLDGDDDLDLVLTDPGTSDGELWEGRAVIHLNDQGFSAQPDWTTTGNHSLYELAYPAALDADGDGMLELWLANGDKQAAYPDRTFTRLGPTFSGELRTERVVFEAQLAEGNHQTLMGIASLDANGDGILDLMVGESVMKSDSSNGASAYHLLLGGPDGFSAIPDRTIERFNGGDRVRSMGDLDGDGRDEVLLGRHQSFPGSVAGRDENPDCWVIQYSQWYPDYDLSYYNFDAPDCPRPSSGVTVLLGSDDPEAAESREFQVDEFFFGLGATPAGDVNADGFTDVVMYYAQGLVGVWHGDATGLYGEAPTELLAVGLMPTATVPAIAALGDVDGDGFDDFALSDFQDAAGEALVYYGGLTLSRSTLLHAPKAGVDFGLSVAGLGDINGDGYQDLGVGSIGDGAFIYYGAAGGIVDEPSEELRASSDGLLGYMLQPAGDVDGDGYADVLARPVDSFTLRADERPQYTGLEPVRLWAGGPSGLSDEPLWEMDAGWGTGHEAVGVGDLDGDGLDDFALTGNRRLVVVYGSEIAPPPEPTQPTEPTTTTTDSESEGLVDEPEAGAEKPPAGCACSSRGGSAGFLLPLLLLALRRR